MSAFTSAARWLLRKIGLFVGCVVIFVAGMYLHDRWTEYEGKGGDLRDLKLLRQGLDSYIDDVASKERTAVQKRVAELQAESIVRLKECRLENKKDVGELDKSRNRKCFASADCYREKAAASVKWELRTRELTYIESLIKFAEVREGSSSQEDRLRRDRMNSYSALQENKSRQEKLKSDHGATFWIPFTRANDEYLKLKQDYEFLNAKDWEAFNSLQSFKKTAAATQKKLPRPLDWKLAITRIDVVKASLRGKLDAEIRNLDGQLQGSWFRDFRPKFHQAILYAIAAVVGGVLLPPIIRAGWYFGVAPLSSRCAPIQLRTRSSRDDSLGDRGAPALVQFGPSLAIDLSPNDELLVHPDFLQSVAQNCRTDTMLLFSWAMPFTSLAANLYGLTRIRAEDRQRFVVSSTRDPFLEVAALELPAGETLVLHPRSLVGVVQTRKKPLKIDRVWRFGWIAWLTLQFRYVMFEGPAMLILQGCRGVRVESADDGRSIDQAATIGFSADLQYSSRRSETFWAYLTGKHGLFNDSFSGGPGVYIYEEMPHFGRRTGITGRGLEGFIDVVLDAFGIT